MRLPKTVTLGSGNRRWRIEVRTHTLSEFRATYLRAFGAPAEAPLWLAYWDDAQRVVNLRADRSPEQRLLDLKHELGHAFTDWLDWAFPDPRSGK